MIPQSIQINSVRLSNYFPNVGHITDRNSSFLFRLLILFVVFIISSLSVQANPIEINGTKINMPTPEGMFLVTPDIETLYKRSQMAVDSENELLAYFVPESVIPAALSGEDPGYERFCVVKISKELKVLHASNKEFEALKSIIQERKTEILDVAKGKIEKNFQQVIEQIEQENETGVQINFNNIIWLDSHENSDRTIAFSSFFKTSFSFGSLNKDNIIAATTTFINVQGKILSIYCYGTQDDLEWTRGFSKKWADSIINKNQEKQVQQPSSSGPKKTFWYSV